ncbi:hypothetical protein KO500_05045 [Cellulophaga baltica]|uniref:hypothetical protein n=1 Tax=Cellulophaga TaxID=104264 RepID=UPI001C067B90|nr:MULTISPECIES: hypothetical protein [Cellulophaga]MBU2995786.1 hypothetical protein [Cellulophaga baltica]MDO6767180.1 hypothetical protein [Cellulophaga sp. 1_MG-2023]
MTFYKTLITIVLVVITISCDENVEETVTKKSVILPNSKHITIEKKDTRTTSIGIFTKHNYGTKHNFKYNVFVNEGKINWDFGVGEPKHIVFCENNTYLHYLNEKIETEEIKDSITDSVEKIYTSKIQNNYQKFIDERYFFKLFGDVYWLDIPEEEYNTILNSCEEYDVPNDNELSILVD